LTEKIKRVATAHHGIWNYDRAQALVDGRVKVEGCELDIELLRPEITFAKAFTEAPFDVCEISFSNTVTAVSKAAQATIKKIAAHGVALVTVTDAWMSGRGAYYVEMIAKHGLVAIHTAASSPLVAPPGGIRPVLGTNPIAIAVPSSPGPIVLDMGTSAYIRPTLPAVRHAILELFARLPPQRCRFVENGFAASSSVSKFAKVVLVSMLMPRRRPDRALPLADLPQPPRGLRVLCLEARRPLPLVKEVYPAHICNVWRGRKPHKGFCALVRAA
jgi:hypothetical protein